MNITAKYGAIVLAINFLCACKLSDHPAEGSWRLAEFKNINFFSGIALLQEENSLMKLDPNGKYTLETSLIEGKPFKIYHGLYEIDQDTLSVIKLNEAKDTIKTQHLIVSLDSDTLKLLQLNNKTLRIYSRE